ncbi:unnamed protein product [Boreogadus saida]
MRTLVKLFGKEQLMQRKRLNSGLQKYRALDHSTGPKLLPGHLTCPLVEVCREREVSRVLQKLSGLVGEESARVRPHHLVKVLEGLKPWQLCLPDLCVAIEVTYFDDFDDLFLCVDNRLQPELCFWGAGLSEHVPTGSREEHSSQKIVRENVVQMPREEYDAWLCSRVNLPSVPAFLHRQQMTSPSPLSQPSFVLGEGIREDSRQTNRTAHMLMRNLVKGDDSDRD